MTNKINWKLAILAGFLGTVMFDIVGFILTGNWWDIPALLGAKTELGFVYGLGGHFSNGILLAVLYAGITSSLWGPTWFRVLLFVTVQTIALVWLFMLPLLGAGIAGINMDPMMPFITMARHWTYAIVLFLILHQESYLNNTNLKMNA